MNQNPPIHLNLYLLHNIVKYKLKNFVFVYLGTSWCEFLFIPDSKRTFYQLPQGRLFADFSENVKVSVVNVFTQYFVSPQLQKNNVNLLYWKKHLY